MESYTNFAYVYDTFMDQEPYDQWADLVCGLLGRFLPDTEQASGAGAAQENRFGEKGIGERTVDERRIVVDLGCGTGKLTELLAARGYDMIGIDLSEDMLAIAQQRKEASGSSILYSLQDMREFELYGAAGAMVSVGDSINYLLEEEDLAAMFRCVERALLPGGVFVFDFKTVHLYRDVIGDRTIAEDRGGCAFIWDNYYDPETCINEYDLAIFVAEGADGPEGCARDIVPVDEAVPPGADRSETSAGKGAEEDPAEGTPQAYRSYDGALFRRYEEVHRQRGYEMDRIRQIAEQAGLIWVTAVDAQAAMDAAEGVGVSEETDAYEGIDARLFESMVTGETERVMAVVRKEMEKRL